MRDLDAIFAPKSVAVVGASAVRGKVGHDIFVNILKGGYKGVLYPVNPNAESIASVRAYPTISDIPYALDLAMIIVPPKIALRSVHEAIDKGVKGVVIVSAGFKEVGGEGLAVEQEIKNLCRESGVRLVGPNCLGVINPLENVRLNASFSTRMPKAGNVSFISQSGALCTAVLDFAGDRDFGFSKFISIGNKADVDEVDLLRYFQDDPDTEVIMIYVEELQRGQEFIEIAKEITGGNRPKPILVIKSGRTVAGAQAAASHTGSLAGSEAVYDAIFAQSGIIRVERIDELFDFAIAFAYKNENAMGKMRRKVPHGNRVAIVTNAGGPGIVATDMTVFSGLALAQFSEGTVDALVSHLPATANVHNPVDIIGDAAQDRYEIALNTVIKDEGVDGALVILTPQSMTNAIGTAEAIVRIARRSHKPILCCFMGIVDVSAGVKYLQENGVPVYPFPEQAAKAFGAVYRYSQWLNRVELAPFSLKHDKEKAREIVESSLAAGTTYLGELTGLDLLKCYGFNVLPTVLATTAQEAVKEADGMGYPVAMKIVSSQIVHKSDAGGVRINVSDARAVARAFDDIIANARAYKVDAPIDGVLVQKMAPKGQEVILGATHYPKFGHLLMFGSGGVMVEVSRMSPSGWRRSIATARA
jgi:acetate---CoA ligase (ADP-forming)